MNDDQGKFAIFQNTDGEPTVAVRFEDGPLRSLREERCLTRRAQRTRRCGR